MGKYDHRHMSLSSRHGFVLSSVLVLGIFSILLFVGKLQTFLDIKEGYYIVHSAFNTTYGTSDNIDVSTKDYHIGLDMSTSTIAKPYTSLGKTAENISSKIISGAHDDENNGKQTEKNYIVNHQQRGENQLEVAWLMSFPNSGTTYTNHLIQDYTNTTTATNYGHEQNTKEESISVFSHSIDGPFFRYPSWSLPPKYILTKTHCGGECDACQTPGRKQYNNTIDAFEIACRSGKRIFNKTKIRTTYSPDIPKRAVHLIRDPFDNIVARLHLKERRWTRHSNDAKYEERIDLFNKTKDGFQAYCRFRDTESFKQEMRQRLLSDELLQYAKQVPCYAEFITYTQWHNHAITLVAKKNIPVLTLFYGDYASDWDGTVNRLLKFLSLSPVKGAKAEEFILGKHYDAFYSEEEKLAAMKLIQALASTELWDLLQRYFS